MLYVVEYANGNIRITADHTDAHNAETVEKAKVHSRHSIKSYHEAEQVAELVNERAGQYETYLPVDNGPHIYPRYDIVAAPAEGELVSRGFNGDYYPDGEITKVAPGPKYRIETSTGGVYYRRKLTSNWIRKGGTWSLVKGHIDERNPHF